MEANGIGPAQATVPTTRTTAPATDPAQQPTQAAPKPQIKLQTPTAEMGWLPGDVDLDAIDMAVPAPPMWEYKDRPIQGRTFTSWGDPHEITGDNLRFDNMKRGEFIKLMSASGDLIVQTRQDSWVKNSLVTVNTAAAIKLGNDLVTYDMVTKSFTLNGNEIPLEPGKTMTLPDGGQLMVGVHSIDMMSAKGDKVSILLQDSYIDITGEVAANRKDGEIRGSLGAFDNDTDGSNDLMGRTGDAAMGAASDGKVLDKFLEEWRAQGGESLFRRAEDLSYFNQILDPTKALEITNAMKEFLNKYYDMNGDGQITKQEYLFVRASGRALRLADLDGNGVVTKNEYKYDPTLAARDRDGDGKVTAIEYFKNSMGWDMLRELRDELEAAEVNRKKRQDEEQEKLKQEQIGK